MKWLVTVLFVSGVTFAAGPRARDLGVPFEGTPGPLNAITDVKGVEVGHRTIISGQGELKVGVGPVRTGVTAIFPRGKGSAAAGVFAGWFALNGNGEMTGTAWVEESGQLDGPIVITNTHSVGVARDAVIKWQLQHTPPADDAMWWSLPVVAETWDGFLNDINGFHVKESHVFEALNSAKGGAVEEGNVGGGTGMVAFGFKGGIGTASRITTQEQGSHTVGVLVQANFGRRNQLRIAGVPVGQEIQEAVPYASGSEAIDEETGSIIIVIATNAPLLPHQLERLARRASLGIARAGGVAMNGSGDIFMAFSTANQTTGSQVAMLPNGRINPLIEATVQATEEAIINALVAARTMVGISDRRVIELPHQRLREVLKRYGRLVPF